MPILHQPDRVEGYEPFFGLTEPAFSLAPDTRFLFASASHSAALAQIVYALERREPLVVITGEIGTGKTLLCRTVLQQLRRKTFLSVITDPLLERDDLLKQLLQDFGVISQEPATVTEARRPELIQALHAFLRSLAPIQAHAVVIIDEAQHLQPGVLEQIRLLSNIDDERGTLLQIILVGQPDLDELLARPELRQLQQRVSRRFRLEPLNRDEVQLYITHRLTRARKGPAGPQDHGAVELARELAAWDGTSEGVEFTADAIRAVTEISGGLPRVINLLCDRSLEEAYVSRRRVVYGTSVHAAAQTLGLEVAAGSAAPALHTDEAVPAVRSLHQVPAAAPSPEMEEAARIADAEREDFWTVAPRELAPPDAALLPDGPAAGERPLAPARPSMARYAVLAAALVVAVAAGWFGVRAFMTRPAASPAATTAPPLPAAAAPTAAPDPSPAVVPPPGPAPAAAAQEPAPVPAVPLTASREPIPPAAGASAAGGAERFDIVVASFRTDARAAAVSEQVTALGLPIHRRVTDGWQQVMAGPFASRGAAAAAQQQLDRAGLTGTRIVPAGR